MGHCGNVKFFDYSVMVNAISDCIRALLTLSEYASCGTNKINSTNMFIVHHQINNTKSLFLNT